MSMALRIYFVDQDRLAAALAPRRGGLWSMISSRTLLEWVDKELNRADREVRKARRTHRGYASEIPCIVEDVLLSNLEWESGAPGIECVVEIGMYQVTDDLGKIGAKLPRPVADRFFGSDYRGWTRFPPDLPADSPIRVLNLPGWQFLPRKDIEALEAAYEAVDKSDIYVEDDERTLYIEDERYNEWDLLFKKHRSRRSYDYSLFRHDWYL